MANSSFDVVVDAFLTAGMVVKGGRDQCRAQCPAHGSRSLTVSLRRGDGRAYVHCFAGCDAPEVLAAVGLSLRHLYDDDGDHDRVRLVVRRQPSAWDQAMVGLGLHRYPSLEHVLRRMEVEAIKEGLDRE